MSYICICISLPPIYIKSRSILFVGNGLIFLFFLWLDSILMHVYMCVQVNL